VGPAGVNSTIAHPEVPTGRPLDSAVAPAWHTAIVLFALLGLSSIGAHVDLRSIFGMHGRLLSYLFVMAFEWTTVAFIGWGLKRRGLRLFDVVGGRWARAGDVFRDLGIGIAFILIIGGAVQGLGSLFKIAPPQGMLEMLPQTWIEIIAWIPVSMTGGFCEEVIFRGYLQRQFSSFTHSLTGGIVFQALAFGLAHGYQGWKLMSLIAIYGAGFGLLAHWRHSLRPGMIGHALQDTAGGLLARLLTH
jgi:membrane protease YdiL (CAAX protease family)